MKNNNQAISSQQNVVQEKANTTNKNSIEKNEKASKFVYETLVGARHNIYSQEITAVKEELKKADYAATPSITNTSILDNQFNEKTNIMNLQSLEDTTNTYTSGKEETAGKEDFNLAREEEQFTAIKNQPSFLKDAEPYEGEDIPAEQKLETYGSLKKTTSFKNFFKKNPKIKNVNSQNSVQLFKAGPGIVRKRFKIVGVSFVLFFCSMLFVTQGNFSNEKSMAGVSKLFQNSVATFEALPIVRSFGDILGLKEDANDMADYKLTIVSKSLDMYFKNLLTETQGVLSSKEIASGLIGGNNKDYLASGKARAVLADYIKKNKDVLGFSLYGLNIKPLVSVKYEEIPNYEINKNLISVLENRNNVLLKHESSDNLVLFSKVFYEGGVWLYVVQTLHPAFFSRILAHLEINDELFYIRDMQNYVMLDNFDAVDWNKENGTDISKGGFFTVYNNLVKKEEHAVSLHLDEVSYKLGMVVVKNTFWGEMVVLSLMAIIFSFCFFLVLQLTTLVRVKKL